MMYNWQQSDWPDFKYNTSQIDELLIDFAQKSGKSTGLLEALPNDYQQETVIELMVAEAIKTSEIENEYLSHQDVMSSIRRNLGFKTNMAKTHDLRAEGASELMVSVRENHDKPLSKEMLFNWHRMIMKGSKGINAGQWRTHKDPMQVVSGSIGKETVHFEAPPSMNVPKEMQQFISWFNDTAPGRTKEIKKAPVRSAIAHAYFETIHPFEDGNGRIGRAISEKAISEGMGKPALISLSRTIEANKNDYYNALKEAQSSNDLTHWINYFVQVVVNAQAEAEELIAFIVKKSKFFDRYKNKLNERQMRVTNRMLEEGSKGFEGGMSAKKYMSIAKTTKATATRDLQDLVEKEVFLVSGGGRSTRYEVNLK
ncbi:Fic family protein [Fulvivirga sp. M361]|uniref:Fic family protein n=1 Tax=Fulvivirga sp. M361 TaxID=2594266 RepID=UPI00117B69B2|nr:Fic family protein [Fulvivirga sp. M361]TRX54325.1 Fic family protein [Fulvivirga sp. M361]